jgi:hypothetical protein
MKLSSFKNFSWRKTNFVNYTPLIEAVASCQLSGNPEQQAIPIVAMVQDRAFLIMLVIALFR